MTTPYFDPFLCLNFLIHLNDPDMGFWQYEYDALGNLETQTDARGCVTNIAYDELNRPTGKTYSGCPATGAVTYTYDAGTNGKGRRISMTDASGSTSWLYDSRGRVRKETKVISGISFDTSAMASPRPTTTTPGTNRADACIRSSLARCKTSRINTILLATSRRSRTASRARPASTITTLWIASPVGS
ncbi:MAG: hypothetical protein DCC54_05680 [Anaerolineae bacterium]|nr:MAG: hypothetical protein DCC54_05680 [Anaerolineae bacterium]